MATITTDVLIVGMGPTGLVLANLLGARGVRTFIKAATFQHLYAFRR